MLFAQLPTPTPTPGGAGGQVTPPPFGAQRAKATPTAASPAVSATSSAVKQMDGLWAVDEYRQPDLKECCLSGAFLLKDGKDSDGVASVSVLPDGKLVFSLKPDTGAADFSLEKQNNGSYIGTKIKGGGFSPIILRRIDPPKNAEPVRVTALKGKWAYTEGGDKLTPLVEWEFKFGKLVRPYCAKGGDIVTVKTGVISIKSNGSSFTFYPVFDTGAKVDAKPAIVEFRGVHITQTMSRFFKLVPEEQATKK